MSAPLKDPICFPPSFLTVLMENNDFYDIEVSDVFSEEKIRPKEREGKNEWFI